VGKKKEKKKDKTKVKKEKGRQKCTPGNPKIAEGGGTKNGKR